MSAVVMLSAKRALLRIYKKCPPWSLPASPGNQNRYFLKGILMKIDTFLIPAAPGQPGQSKSLLFKRNFNKKRYFSRSCHQTSLVWVLQEALIVMPYLWLCHSGSGVVNLINASLQSRSALSPFFPSHLWFGGPEFRSKGPSSSEAG